MQKNVGKNTKKLYFTTAIISFVLVLAISLTLIFTLGARSSGGSGDGNNSGTIGSVSTTLNAKNGALTAGTGLKAENTTTEYNVTVTNNSDFPVYLRARVILTGSAAKGGNYFNYDSAWTYAADNYLYYKDAVAKGATSTALFTTANVTGTYRFVVEALQEEAAVPNVKVDVGTKNFVNGNTINADASETIGTASCTLIQNGLKKYAIPLNWSTDASARTLKITNNGKQDLDVKFRISSVAVNNEETSSSEWMVEGVKIKTAGSTGAGTDTDYEWFPNAGYYQLKKKLAIGETVEIAFGDANKNNGIDPKKVNIDLTLQDYIVATDVYSIVDATTLQNVGEYKGNGEFEISNATETTMKNLAIYSYNNINKFVYVKTTSTDGNVTYNGTWGNFEGEDTGVSGAVIAPKSCSEKLFATAAAATNDNKYTIKVWTAQTIDNATISVIKATSTTLNNGTMVNDDPKTGNYQPVDNATEDPVATSDMILDAYSGKAYTDLSDAEKANVATGITNKWASLAVKSGDSSDMLVRVSLSFAWGTYSNSVWTPNTDALGFSPSVFYGDGFSFNSEDQSLTYNYNLAKGQATSALLDFTDTTTSGTTRATELEKMAQAVVEKKQALKLSVMVEAIYAVGSQLDILKLDTVPTTSESKSYYTSDDIGNYTSMTKESEMIVINATSPNSSDATAGTISVSDLNKYVVYVTNNFPVGVRVAVALQWGTYSNGVWTAATTDAGANSTVNLGEYLTSNWKFDTSLGGYNYKCSIPGKCATAPIFASDLTALATAISDEYTSRSDTNNKHVRVVIMAETTHKV